jgi:hypothetical protein
MIRRTALAAKREKPRRKAPERVQQVRVKPKAGAAPTADEKRHMDRMAALPCLVCGRTATIHHVTARITGGRIARSHQRIVPLCPIHHQKVHDPKAADPVSVEGLGHGGFWLKYGINLLAVADRLWKESCDGILVR